MSLFLKVSLSFQIFRRMKDLIPLIKKEKNVCSIAKSESKIINLAADFSSWEVTDSADELIRC